jgi:hypothetical protein
LVFAQDGFSWDGNVQIGTIIRGVDDFDDIDPNLTGVVQETTRVPIIEPFGRLQGDFNFYYKNSGLTLDTNLIVRYMGSGYNEGSADITFGVTYSEPERDSFGFHINTYIIQAAGTANAIWFSTGPDRLWMYYNLMGGDLNLYVSYKGRAEEDFKDGWMGDWRISDLFLDTGFIFNPLDSSLNLGGTDPVDNQFGSGLRLKYLGIPGLDAGITFGAKGAFAGHSLDAVGGTVNKAIFDFVRSFLVGHSILGAQYSFDYMGIDGLTAALMLGMETLYDETYVDSETHLIGKHMDTTMHLYLGADYKLDNNSGFFGEVRVDDILANYNDGLLAHVGIGCFYSSGPLYAGLNLRAFDLGEVYATVFSVQPRLHYNFVEDTLQARLPVEFASSGNDQTLTFSPTLVWNIARDGLNNKIGIDGDGDYLTGIVIKYNLGFLFSQDTNRIFRNNCEITFRVSF